MTTATINDRATVEPVVRDEHGNSEPYVKQHLADLSAQIEAQREREARTQRPLEDLDKDMKERLNRRAIKAMAARAGRILLWVVLVVTLLGFVGTALYVNIDKIVTDYDKFGMDSRECIAKVGERTITGTRVYSYRYMTVLGHKIYMTPQSEVKQETRIDVSGNGMTILASSNGVPIEKYNISEGEKYRQLLKPAESYTFFMDGGKNTAILAYNQICK